MPVPARLLASCVTALLATACVQTVGGTAVRPTPGFDEGSLSPVDVDTVLLDQQRMRAITGAGYDLTVVPSMDGKIPVDIDVLMAGTPSQCQWFFAESQTFGSDVEEFHKTTFQNPPDGGLISEGAAAYRDPQTARQAFDGLVGLVDDCGTTSSGALFVGDWTATVDSVQTRPSTACGRDYRLKTVVLIEVTSCSFPESVPDIVMTNIAANVPD